MSVAKRPRLPSPSLSGSGTPTLRQKSNTGSTVHVTPRSPLAGGGPQPSTPAPIVKSNQTQREEACPQIHEILSQASPDGPHRYNSVLSRELYEASLEARVTAECRLRRQIAQANIDVEHMNRDLDALVKDRLRMDGYVSQGADQDPCWLGLGSSSAPGE